MRRKSCCKIALILFDYFVKSAWSFPPWLPWYMMQKVMKFRWEGQGFIGHSRSQDLQNSTREILNKTFLRGWCFREEGLQIQVEIIKSSMLINFMGTVEPIDTFLSSFYGTTPGVQPLSFAREWREKKRSPHETEISTLSRIFFKIKHQISEKNELEW